VTVAQHAAVAVIGVLAQAHVGDAHEIGNLASQRAQSGLNRAARIPRR
jgi:hypothetical protein